MWGGIISCINSSSTMESAGWPIIVCSFLKEGSQRRKKGEGCECETLFIDAGVTALRSCASPQKAYLPSCSRCLCNGATSDGRYGRSMCKNVFESQLESKDFLNGEHFVGCLHKPPFSIKDT